MTLRWRLEAWGARIALALARRLGLRAGSALGGAVTRAIGPWLGVSRVGRRNLALAFPERDPGWREAVLKDAWENLGRSMMELPHLPGLPQTESGPGWELVGAGNMPPGAKQLVFFSAHIGNWEVLPLAAQAFGLTMGSLYRAPDNPLVDAVVRQMREGGAELPLFPKGSRGARQALKHLAGGQALGLVVDQKLNEGIELDFLGQRAMTATAPAELALRFGCPLIPVHVQRIEKNRFRVVVEPPLAFPATGDKAEDIRILMQRVNDHIGAWIRDRPQDWLWLHRRFPRELYRRK
ncbi:lauroyl acyltransferase [Pseudoroseomonas deserti]|uniref:Lauroyl acyltransferase n=1 Tax=Teichococcus deserti TaxID=1817963 RepID=A0A1V2H556_9PROT|nr:lauroyl acyltransferase [Pseudoroseomonas deserti]ONG55697.1 lauroyl acyltransferase [Pseudoroseomonas deserti]